MLRSNLCIPGGSVSPWLGNMWEGRGRGQQEVGEKDYLTKKFPDRPQKSPLKLFSLRGRPKKITHCHLCSSSPPPPPLLRILENNLSIGRVKHYVNNLPFTLFLQPCVVKRQCLSFCVSVDRYTPSHDILHGSFKASRYLFHSNNLRTTGLQRYLKHTMKNVYAFFLLRSCLSITHI